MSERRETRYRMHLASGVILDVDANPPDFPDSVEDVPDEEWRELGTIDPVTGQAQVDSTRASAWRPLAERWRWR